MRNIIWLILSKLRVLTPALDRFHPPIAVKVIVRVITSD